MNYTTHKLRDHASAQCHVDTFDNGDIRFISYNTMVIYFRKSTGFLYCTGTYSQTTRKQIGWFLREYFPDASYYTMKRCYEQNEKCSPITGEIDTLKTLELRLMDGSRLYPDDFDAIGEN